jgi:pimeloyl-ACP methyl ester carboxylesterase
MAVWRYVQGEIGRSTRACSYDRAGFGFSDPPTGPADARAAVEDIHRLLKAGHVAAPVIYVGHSFAGLIGVLLQATYPTDVSAEVLVDPSFADQDFAKLATLRADKRKGWLLPDYDFVASMKRCAAIVGVLPKDCLLSESDPKPNEYALTKVERRQVSRRSYIKTQISEYESFLPKQGTRDTSVDQEEIEHAQPQFGDKPLVILTRDGSPQYWKSGHDKLAALSTKGRNIVIPGATHSMINEMPKPVIDAVLDVVGTMRH